MNKYKFNLLTLLTVTVASLIAGCVLPPIPQPTSELAIVELYTLPGRSLMADTLDRKWVNDGRYFAVPEGRHRLAVRFQYDKAEIAGPFIGGFDYITCLMAFYYDFQPNTIYRLEARPMVTGGQLFISQGEQTTRLDFAQVDVSCGPY